MQFERAINHWVIVREEGREGYISTQTVEANLLFEILSELRKINSRFASPSEAGRISEDPSK